MYDSIELIQKSAAVNKLNRLFTEILSDMTQKTIVINDINDINMREILSHLDEDDVLVTNDNYIQELCDYQVINNRGKIMLTIDANSELINGCEQHDYLDESLCEQLSKTLDIMRSKYTCVRVITTAA